MLYNKLPIATADSYTKVKTLRKEMIRLKTELNATSAQDQFAKWAKLQRQYDKVATEHDTKGKLDDIRATIANNRQLRICRRSALHLTG